MIKTNLYLSAFTPDKMEILIELLKYKGDYLSTHYYEVSFVMSDDKNDIEVKDIKVIEDILPYLDATFKKRSIKESQLEESTSKYMLNKIFDKVIKKDNITFEKLKADINSDVEIVREKDFIHKNIDKVKLYNQIIDKPIKDNEYIYNKKLIKDFLINKKGIK